MQILGQKLAAETNFTFAKNSSKLYHKVFFINFYKNKTILSLILKVNLKQDFSSPDLETKTTKFFLLVSKKMYDFNYFSMVNLETRFFLRVFRVEFAQTSHNKWSISFMYKKLFSIILSRMKKT